MTILPFRDIFINIYLSLSFSHLTKGRKKEERTGRQAEKGARRTTKEGTGRKTEERKRGAAEERAGERTTEANHQCRHYYRPQFITRMAAISLHHQWIGMFKKWGYL